MIRREMSLPSDGVWALISQVEHARLAGELARRWRMPLVPGNLRAASVVDVQDELLAAIEHHDDGWAEWEEAPDIDPAHGRPRSFLEMPQPDSLAIWSKSIAVAEQIGPLAAWVVAGHFAALLKVGESRTDEALQARAWNELIRARRDAWLRDWIEPLAGRTLDVADYSLRTLQFFDAASLWVCCMCPPEGAASPDQVDDAILAFADGTEYRLTAGAGNTREMPWATIRPWPLAADDCRLAVDCLRATWRRYATMDELLSASQPHRLTWRLRADRHT